MLSFRNMNYLINFKCVNRFFISTYVGINCLKGLCVWEGSDCGTGGLCVFGPVLLGQTDIDKDLPNSSRVC